MLSEISQSEKDKYCIISLICGIFKKKKLIEKKIRFVVTRSWVWRNWMKVVKRYKLPVIR